uniref:Sugar transporter SWEET1 n=1 Tax=Rhizochromulina marina TaxID=1034831 RepID=A0A7S2SSR1_9STRA|mmetsp:Transcript_6559/g.19200  ORF Transcript_6559/g.19200 Transcript_6559/m.19200 type:complete len:330 (+) Transcript_6559:215-1204(+)
MEGFEERATDGILVGQDPSSSLWSEILLLPSLATILKGVGPMAALATVLLNLAPVMTVLEFCRKGSTGRLPLLPYSGMMLSGFSWAFYGVLTEASHVFLPNAFGLCAGALYFACFCWNVPREANWLPGTVRDHLAAAAVVLVVAIAAVASLPKDLGVMVIGWLGCILCVVMFSGPLASVQTILKERSTRSLPLPFTIAVSINCTLWTIYGAFVANDPFLYVPSLMGILSAAVQLSLFARFGCNSSPSSSPPPPLIHKVTSPPPNNKHQGSRRGDHHVLVPVSSSSRVPVASLQAPAFEISRPSPELHGRNADSFGLHHHHHRSRISVDS